MSGDHHHHHHHHGKGSKNILLAFFLNFSFSIIELIGGYYTNSIAITSDALHDFGDAMALLFSYFAEKLSHRQPNETYTYGYRRFSVISALVNGVILLSGSLYVLYEAIMRLQSPEMVQPKGMILLAVIGIVVNALAAFKLSKEDGLNQRMVMFHMLEDLLGWVAVLIVSVILMFKPWYQLDSILSILISLIILKGVYGNIKKVLGVLLQQFPNEIEIGELKKEIMAAGPIIDLHALKGWSIDGESHYLSFHIIVNGDTPIAEVDKIKVKINEILDRHNVVFSSLEFEGEKAGCQHLDS